MTILADSRESNRQRRDLADGVKLLKYDGENDEAFSYDYEVHTKGGRVIKVEIKAWADYVQSWLGSKLERQLAAVNLFVVEKDPLEYPMVPEVALLWTNASKHLAVLSANMWIIQTTGPEETMMLLRHIEQREDLTVRANGVRGARESVRWAILRCLPGVNPDRVLSGGKRLGDYLESMVDWPRVLHGLKLSDWSHTDLGADSFGKRVRGIGPATIAKIERALLGNEK